MLFWQRLSQHENVIVSKPSHEVKLQIKIIGNIVRMMALSTHMKRLVYKLCQTVF